ncbi:probable rRNA maturation factor [Hathewaya proteolytica DSM 3090]|uniref:Endoribonuclease YbeY n=1 Tax=Hathewaya proteolytica DSM 3090 TaxID=1121331 RepID=A0A1M6JFQ7_9CLOT|nr:rRNA maturation RNase YbeY [Hathewaya proteolytica]SHJ45505.1 probable rRNA maturation factor [Hathewaya proteolytica DSM 3090]
MLFIDDRQNNIEIDDTILKLMEDLIEYSLKEECVNIDTEISVIFVDDDEIKDINRQERKKDVVTDVLSFPMLYYKEHTVYKENYPNNSFHITDLDDGKLVLGDIVLNLKRAMEQSIEFGHSFKREMCYLLIHSVLHLLGYDHMEECDKIKMRQREEEILNKFDVKREI